MTENDDTQNNESEDLPQEPSQEVDASQATTNESTDSGFSLQTVIDDALKVITNPVSFYRDMPTSGGFANPLIFVVTIAFATALIGFVLDLIGLANFNTVTGGPVSLVAVIAMPIGAAIGSFIVGGILFVIWKLMGSEKSYEIAYRCVAYSFAIMPIMAVISFIPYVAGIVKTLWGMFLLYTASIEVHKIKDSTAQIVFGILALILVIGGINAERGARKMMNWAENFEERMSQEFDKGSIGNAVKELEGVENMTPEEAGKKFGEFLKGMEEFSKGMEEAAKEAEAEQENN